MARPTNALTLAEAAERIGARLIGDGARTIRGIAPVARAEADQLTFLANPKYQAALGQSRAGGVILAKETPSLAMAQLVVDDPYYGYCQLMEMLYLPPRQAAGVSADARVAAEHLGTAPDIAPFVTVGEGTVIGDRVTLHAGARVGKNCTLGDDVTLHPNVVVRDGCVLGHRVIVQPGAVIGADGFGYATHQGVHHKIPHVGRVVLQDDVEIGANTTIDRGVMGDTVIGAGSKLDNLVQVAHNVEIGRGCIMVSQSGISGSTTLGDYVVLGGQVGVAGHLSLGDQLFVGAKSGITKDVPGRQTVSGFPVMPHRQQLKVQVATAKLPALRERITKLERQLAKLQSTES